MPIKSMNEKLGYRKDRKKSGRTFFIPFYGKEAAVSGI